MCTICNFAAAPQNIEQFSLFSLRKRQILCNLPLPCVKTDVLSHSSQYQFSWVRATSSLMYHKSRLQVYVSMLSPDSDSLLAISTRSRLTLQLQCFPFLLKIMLLWIVTKSLGGHVLGSLKINDTWNGRNENDR